MLPSWINRFSSVSGIRTLRPTCKTASLRMAIQFQIVFGLTLIASANSGTLKYLNGPPLLLTAPIFHRNGAILCLIVAHPIWR
jgi:hypothetical protein